MSCVWSIRSPAAGGSPGLLTGEGHEVGRCHVATPMKRMGIAALYRRPSPSKPAPGHKVHPFLLRNLAVVRPDQVWAMDITTIPMAHGFVRLAAVVDWFSRKVLAWTLPITLSAACLASRPWRRRSPATGGRRSSTWSVVAPSVRAAMRRQGSQFTSAEFIAVPKTARIAISMDGRGAWRDNLFAERPWRTVKHEGVYRRAYTGVTEARAPIGRHLGVSNGTRPHSSLGGQTPDRAYLDQPTPIPAAA